ncbi:MAG: hypothetical protein FJZ59_06980 [Chlamydiae bacterium]|nr:hypothetical protein [Chlamydiota bacterium]
MVSKSGKGGDHNRLSQKEIASNERDEIYSHQFDLEIDKPIIQVKKHYHKIGESSLIKPYDEGYVDVCLDVMPDTTV